MKRLFLLWFILISVSCKHTRKDQPAPMDLLSQIEGTYKMTSLSYNDMSETISDQGRNGKISFFKSDRNMPNIEILVNWIDNLSWAETTDMTLKASGDTVLISTWQKIGYVLGDNVILEYNNGYNTVVKIKAIKQ